MFDPLSSTFGEDNTTLAPPWPTTPHSPFDPIPNLPRPSSRPVTPQPGGTPERPAPVNTGLYGREPQIYGQPEPGLISPRVTTGSNGTNFEKREPYLRVRITGLERNRRDILVKFDAQVNPFDLDCDRVPALYCLLTLMDSYISFVVVVTDKSIEFYGHDVSECVEIVLRIPAVLRSNNPKQPSDNRPGPSSSSNIRSYRRRR